MAYYDDEGDLPRPSQTTVAGVAWVVAGIIGVVLSLLWLFIALNLAGMSDAGFIALVLGGFIVVASFAMWLVSIGKQTLKGRRINLLRSGKVSIVIGAAVIGSNVWMLVADAPSRTALDKQFVTILKGVGVNIGLVLIVVGLLAIAGRAQYEVWRHWKSKRP